MDNLILKSFDALLFDLDGTLVDSMPLHNKAWIETVANHGRAINEDMLLELAGISTLRTVEIFNDRYGWNLDPVLIAKEKESLYIKSLNNPENLKIAEEVLEVARKNFESKKLAIVTGGERETVEKVISITGLRDLFPVVVCAEDTERGKQFPDPFLLAAEKLKVSPEKCLVFEDGDVGIKGAQSAGMGVVKVDLRSEGRKF